MEVKPQDGATASDPPLKKHLPQSLHSKSLDHAAAKRLAGLFKQKIWPSSNFPELLIQRRLKITLATSELRAHGWDEKILQNIHWIRWQGKAWEPWGPVWDQLYNQRPHLEPLFTEIPMPYKQIKILEQPKGKISPKNPGRYKNELLFGAPRYKLNRAEFELFLENLRNLVDVLNEWRKAATTPPFIGQKRLAKKLNKTRAKFMKEYGTATSALWFNVPMFNWTGSVPFFNPTFFHRNPKDIQYFWRLVDLVNELMMIQPPGEIRGKISSLSTNDYLKITKLWNQGLSDAQIARTIFPNVDEADAIMRVQRVRTRIELRRSPPKN